METHIKVAEIFATYLDSKFRIFGIRFGLSMFLDAIPEIGDFIAAFLSLYIVWIAVKMELPPGQIFQMLANIGINLVLGLIPVVGEVTYVLRKANLKNVEILKKYTREQVIQGEVVKG